MKHFTVFIFTLLLTSTTYSQVISQFTWDSNPLTNADIGPNATSVSGNAASAVNGVGGTNGIQAGTVNNVNINLVIPTASGIFDVDGIDVSIDYQREESSGNFFNRGNSLIIKGASNFSVKYRVDNGSGGYSTINSGNAYSIPYDDTYRTYRFYYLPATGYGALLVDGVEVWSNDGPDNRNMYWTGAGNITIGTSMDGSGTNKTFFDNLIIGNIFSSPLPIELTSFNVKATLQKEAEINWTTATETNNDYFTIERSKDGVTWEMVKTVRGAGSSFLTLNYQTVDTSPYVGISYYRLKQTDFDGQFTYSEIQKIDITTHSNLEVTIFPNPATEFITIESTNELGPIIIYNSLGQNVTSQTLLLKNSSHISTLDISTLKKGIYYIKSEKYSAQKLFKL